MPSNSPLSWKWFAAVAAAALLFAAVVAGVFVLSARGPAPDGEPDEPGGKTGPDGPVPREPDRPRPIGPEEKLRLESINQLDRLGVPLPAGAATELSVILSGRVAGPKAVLEAEVKPVGAPFDGGGLRRTPEESAEPAVEVALGPGRYHWRARARTLGGALTGWRAFGDHGDEPDFVIEAAPPPDLPHRGDGAGAAQIASDSSGGTGDSRPRPAIVDPLVPLWSLLAPKAAGVAGVALVVLIAAFIVRRVRGRGPA